MTQCCYKTHREDLKTFPKIDAVSTSQLLRGNTKGISNQYPNATRVSILYILYTKRKNPLSVHRNVLLNSRLDFMCILHDFTCILRDFRRSLLSVMLQYVESKGIR